MANPLIAQGSLNRLKASVIWTSAPELNVTPSYLGAEGIRMSLEGNATTFINTQTGAVTSPEPYQALTVTMALLKTQSLAEQYKARMELNSLLGNGTVRPDVSSGGIGVYQITNAAIETVRELNFAGGDAGWVITVRGYYLINSSLWN